MEETESNRSRESSTTKEGEQQNGAFECAICLDGVTDPVVTMCGHLFCWPCIYRWLDMHPESPSCPTCKAAISQDKLIPLYGRGSDTKDPREKKPEPIPKRPTGQRGENVRESNPQRGPFPDNFFMPPGMGGPFGGNAMHWNTNFGGVNVGVGAFPFGLFGLQFQAGNFNAHGPRTPEEIRQQNISKALFFMAMFILMVITLF